MYTSLPGILYRLQDHYGLPNYNLILYTFRTCSPEDVREIYPALSYLRNVFIYFTINASITFLVHRCFILLDSLYKRDT